MTSWGQAITQAEHPVHNPEVITSVYSSAYWWVQRPSSRVRSISAGGPSVTVMVGIVGGGGVGLARS